MGGEDITSSGFIVSELSYVFYCRLPPISKGERGKRLNGVPRSYASLYSPVEEHKTGLKSPFPIYSPSKVIKD